MDVWIKDFNGDIKVIGGPVYIAYQIDRLHQGPKPA
jgi:hypothetical protein